MSRWKPGEEQEAAETLRELEGKPMSLKEIRLRTGMFDGTVKRLMAKYGIELTIVDGRLTNLTTEEKIKRKALRNSSPNHRFPQERKAPRFVGVQTDGVPVLRAKPWQCKFRLPGYDLQGSARCCGNAVDWASDLPYCVGHARTMRKRDEQD